jgi:hypothetical protein
MSTDSEVKVKINADTGEATEGFALVVHSLKQFAEQFNSEMADLTAHSGIAEFLADGVNEAVAGLSGSAAAWKTELNALTQSIGTASEEAGALRAASALAADRDLWASKLEMARLLAKEQAAIDLEAYRTLADLRTMDLDDEEAELDHKVRMGEMTAQQRVQAERSLIERRIGLRRELLEFEIAAEGATLEERERINGQLVLLDKEMWAALNDNARRAAEEQREYWSTMTDGIKAAFEDCFIGLANGTKSWGDAAQAMMNSVLQGFIKMCAKALMQWLGLETTKTAVTGTEEATRTGIVSAGAIKQLAIKVGTAIKEIAVSAWAGAAAAYKAIAGIPVVGPILAPAAAAVALGGIMAMIGNLPSAAGGYWDVPHDQLAAIHKNEMVLPAAHSARLRDLLEGGGGFQGGGNAGPAVNLTINALDAKGVERVLRDNRGALAKQLRGLARDNYS